jgi:hypothetical protein
VYLSAWSATRSSHAVIKQKGQAMPDQKSKDEARRWNAELDAALLSGGVVDQSLYLQFLEAYRYDAATSVGWVEAKMRVLLGRVRQDRDLSLFAPLLREQTQVRSEADFRAWIRENFAGLTL